MSPAANSDDLDELRSLAIFSALDEEVVRELCDRLVRRQFAAGETVFVEGDPGDAMYVILEGAIDVVKSADGTRPEIRVTSLTAGMWFGEVAMIGVTRRVVCARATRPTSLLAIPARELRELYRSDVKSYALLTMNLARDLARKLQIAEALLADARAALITGGAVSEPSA